MKTNILRLIRRIVGTEYLQKSNEKILSTVEATNQAVMFSQAIQDCPWLKYKGFSFGDFGWAMDALALHNIFRILEDVKPKNILEFGLGQSSKIVHQYAEYYKATAITIEHDQDWINYIKTHAPQINFNVYQADIEKIKINDIEAASYKNFMNICSPALFNEESLFVILDGYSEKNYSRTQALDLIKTLETKDGFCIFMHDSERRGEQETLSLLYEKLSQNGIGFLKRNYRSTKQHSIVCSKNWKFLTSI